jgi:hypothetical protein
LFLSAKQTNHQTGVQWYSDTSPFSISCFNAHLSLPHLPWTTKFPQNGYAKRVGPIHLSSEKVVVRTGHKVLVEVDNNILMIVGDL